MCRVQHDEKKMCREQHDDSKDFRSSIIFFYLERFIHCMFNIFHKFERDLNVFETFEWNVSNDDEIDFDESMLMNLILIFQKKMRSFTFSNEIEFQIDDSIEINFINEIFRNSLFSIIAENADQNDFANSNDLKILNNDNQLFFDSNNEVSNFDDHENVNLFLICFFVSTARN